jgi:hypothetical protein
MVLDKDSQPSDKLPSLPDLPGMPDLPKVTVEGESKSSTAAFNVKPEFSAPDSSSDRDLSVMVDLPSAKVVSNSDEPAAEEFDPYLGKMFGNYELVQKVGQGGMGLVYKGRQVALIASSR